MNTLDQAQQALTRHLPSRKDRYYPAFHLAPPVGWMNDPNGLVYFNHRYHAFYQHHPFSADWGPMHWGHAISEDMVHWHHQPIALAPDSPMDCNGCFSGSAVVDNDRLALIYTGHRWLAEVGDDSQIFEVQCLATSEDGITFTKQGVIVTPPPGVMHFRDPKVWAEDGSWWMVVGARDHQERGQVLLYRGESLTAWRFERVLAEAKPGEGYMWECPDFFKLGEHHYLMCSPQGITTQGDRFANLFQSGVMAGHWSPGNDFTVQHGFTELDNGHDFYAPQSLTAADGRRVMMAWMDMWESVMPTKQEGWCGSFTLPRELSEEAGRLRQRPLRELQALRQEEWRLTEQKICGDYVLAQEASSAELFLQWGPRQSSVAQFGLKIGDGVTLSYHVVEGYLSLKRDYPELGIQDSRRVHIDQTAKQTWQIFIDRSSIEVFINDGQTVLSSRIYPVQHDYQLRLFSEEGELEVETLSFWPLRSAME